MLAETNVTMKKAVGILADLSLDEKLRMIAEAEEKARKDQISREQGAWRRGYEEVLSEVVRNMQKLGYSFTDIARVTELSEAEIAELKS
jgi:predicted transposase/invertase (TIGR01784 family)